MRKIAFLIVILFSAVLAFYAARFLPNHLETNSKTANIHHTEKGQELAQGETPLKNNEDFIQYEPTLVELPQKKAEYHEPIEVELPNDEQEINGSEHEKNEYFLARSLLDQGKNKEFLRLLERKSEEIGQDSENSEIWLKLLLEYAVKNQDYAQLVVIYRYDPSVFDQDEDAALLLGKALIDSYKDPHYWGLRKQWEGRESKDSVWTVLDADAYLFQGRRDEAIDLLKSKEFFGKEDVPRLYRLALLHLAENPKLAFEWLTKAKTLDPENVEVLSYRGKILEMAGRNDLAFTDYYSAWNLDPLNPKAITQLSDFYFRQNDYPRALEILSKNLEKTGDPLLLTKAIFLGKVIKPIKLSKKLDTGDLVLGPYIQYLANLSPWEFWDDSYFERTKASEIVLETEQSAFWLRLLSLLRNNEKQEAYDLLKENPFTGQSWNPELEVSLKEILAYQLYGSPALKNREISLSKAELKARESLSLQNTFLGRINGYSIKTEEDPYLYIPQEDRDILSGNLAYVSALLETSWTESAINIYNENAGSTPPSWLVLNIAKAYGLNRGLNKVLEFAARQSSSPELNLFVAESLVKEGKTFEALKKLNEIRDLKGDIATESAWLKALTLIERGDFAEARVEIQLNAGLDQSLRGKELLAKAALLEGKLDLAEEIYADIGGESLEAKSFLARRHFEKGNIPLAKRLTMELLEKNPSSDVLRKNMMMIEKAGNRARVLPHEARVAPKD